MAEQSVPERRESWVWIAQPLSGPFSETRQRDGFVEDLVALFNRYGVKAERGYLGDESGNRSLCMIQFPYGIADF